MPDTEPSQANDESEEVQSFASHRIAALRDAGGGGAHLHEVLGEIARDSNPDWLEKRVYPLDVLDDIHKMASGAYYSAQPRTEDGRPTASKPIPAEEQIAESANCSGEEECSTDFFAESAKNADPSLIADGMIEVMQAAIEREAQECGFVIFSDDAGSIAQAALTAIDIPGLLKTAYAEGISDGWADLATKHPEVPIENGSSVNELWRDSMTFAAIRNLEPSQ